MITLRQIQFALAVARHKHFKRAADECSISQSALSLGIAEMEKNLGVIIFERNNKQVVITPIGEELLTRAQQIYLDAQQLVERAHAGQGELCFGMHMGFIPTIAPYLLPSALPLLRAEYPKFQLNIHEDTTQRLLDLVHSGKIDGAVIALPFDTSGLHVFTFGEERFYVLLRDDHPLSQKSKITVNELQDLPLLMLSEGHCLKDHIMAICQFHRELGRDTFRQASLNTLVQMTINDMGVTLVPEIALPSLRAQRGIKALPLDKGGVHRQLALVTRPNYPRLDELSLLMELFQRATLRLKEQAQDAPAETRPAEVSNAR